MVIGNHVPDVYAEILQVGGLPACGLSATTSPMYVILNAAGDSVFQFLPILIALTSARRFKVNEFTAFAIAGALVYPDLATLVTLLFKRLIKGMF